MRYNHLVKILSDNRLSAYITMYILLYIYTAILVIRVYGRFNFFWPKILHHLLYYYYKIVKTV